MRGLGYGSMMGVGYEEVAMLLFLIVVPGLAMLVYILGSPAARQCLLDLSFTRFLMVRIASFAYVLNVVMSALFYLYIAYKSFQRSAGDGLLALLVIGPLLFVLWVIWSRVLIELLVVLFRIAENTARLPVGGASSAPAGSAVRGVPAGAAAGAPAPAFCLQCGARREGDGKFCVQCGAATP